MFMHYSLRNTHKGGKMLHEREINTGSSLGIELQQSPTGALKQEGLYMYTVYFICCYKLSNMSSKKRKKCSRAFFLQVE